MNASDLQQAMLKLMDVLSRDIANTGSMADELTRAAEVLSDQPEVEAIRDIEVGKRVKVLELQGRLAALREEYAARFPLKL